MAVSATPRRGTVLIVVLVVIVLLSLSAYTFSELMIAEVDAMERFGRAAAARAFADSGVELAAAWLGAPEEGGTENLFHNPGQFSKVLLIDSSADRARGRVSLVAPVESDPQSRQIRYGLIDESGRINPNAIPGLGLDETRSREILMALPNMTESIADAILDWIDTDDDTRANGVETDFYLSLTPPYEAKNGPLESIDELLFVAGVTPELLFGEDANRNGLLDTNENDGERSLPVDDADGVLNPGWAAYLTVYSRESNLRKDGSPKINLNQSLLTELYDELEEEFGEEIARFIVAYRLKGSTNVEKITDENDENTTGDAETDEALQKAAQNVAGAIAGGSSQDPTTRGGMDLSGGATYEFYSLYDLIDAEVEVEIITNGAPEATTLSSPWTSSPADLSENLPILFDAFTIRDAEVIEGRININQARLECLVGLPDMTAELASAIIAAAPVVADGQDVTDLLAYRSTTGWLLIDGLTDTTTLRKLDRYITARGGVFRVNSVGHFDLGGPVARVEAVIDSTQVPPRIVFQRDLSHLGPGFRVDQLTQ
ncbi:MAG: general secretion pathway protein GspK [Planctomycetaceae bacterium]|nr:general secretion pathway protein GspK [Planctomycetaceae bacterium]